MMKKTLGVFLLVTMFAGGYAQNMRVTKPNFKYFSTTPKKVTPLLDSLSSPEAKKHPEYGILPFNAQCSECVELIDKRTLNTRDFIDPMVPSHIFSQKSFFPLHYKKSADDIWRTIDPRLIITPNNPGVYAAPNQPVPTKCDLNKKFSSLTIGGIEFKFDSNLVMYFVDDSLALSKEQQGNYNNYTVGNQGLAISDIWPDIDMQQVFNVVGEIKTSYIIKKPLQTPIEKGYMVIEDHFNVPDGYTFQESENGAHLENQKFKGDYELKDKNGHLLVTYHKPVYMDANSVGMQGIYRLNQSGNEYSLQMLVPVSWLNRSENIYPLTIDPLVDPAGDSAMGNFIHSGLPSANLGFTSVPLGSCDYHMSVNVQGQSQLLNTFVDIEYQLTYSNMCGNPPEPAPYCLFHQVTQYLSSDKCGQVSAFSCNNIGDTTGFCTTDSSLRLDNGVQPMPAKFAYANFLSCYPPQCPNYDIPFTLRNCDSICGDVCGYLCARGSKWAMTIEACTVNGSISQLQTQICAGQSATFVAEGNCGVPPYHYVWTPDGGNTLDTVYGNPDYVVTTSNTLTTPETISVTCYVFDTCGNYASTNVLSVNVIPAPLADAGLPKELCLGGATTIGGNPTTDNGSTISWAGSTPTVQSWLSSTTAANPTVTVPAGTIDSFYYVLTTQDANCPNTDTVKIYSIAGDQVAIDSLTPIRVCVGQTVTLNTVGGPFLSYLWNNGVTDSLMSTTTPGPYFVIVKDSLGCTDTSNTITVSNFGPPSLAIFPDTTILSGDSVALTSDANLFSASVDSFFWYPNTNITCTTCGNPLVAPLTDQIYGLTIYSHGCQVSAKVLIQVIQPDNFFIPNVFTPNGDGNNDQFYIEYQSGVTVLLFQVFDRWGEKVHDGLYPWDGTYKGKPAPLAVYVYVFKLQLYGRPLALYRKGSVTLLK
jgi:gliding motility-associated-like protein